ncbi:MAG: hypothetical protein M0R80_03040 [Proteobacteria bacterium]|jgi:hypothetical protein|nr:hypothetical protein [Pseudomonadota bacterium]
MNFKEFITESTTSRYSVEVNYRTRKQEVLEAAGKITLGYVSAALKQNGYHVKQLFDETPIRIVVSTRNFEEGEWVGFLIFYSKDGGKYVIANGFYNRGQKSVSLQTWKDAKGDSPAELAAEMRTVMFELKERKDRHLPSLKPIPLKRGPKK